MEESMNLLKGGLNEVPGFSFAAIECGITYKERLDFSLIFSKTPCNASAIFTTNKIIAAPVKLSKERINNLIHGILINSTNANACTGEIGYKNALMLTKEVSKHLNVEEDSILNASTGVIGVQLPIDKMKKSIPILAKSLSIDNAELIPRAIMTTDTFPKEIAASFSYSRGEGRIAGTIKGSGMIAPNMATLLVFILTDFPIEKQALKTIFTRCSMKTLNSITIDGDMSTNDTALILSPTSNQYISDKNDLDKFESALLNILDKLSEMTLSDGEGTTKIVKVNVTEAKTKDDARLVAKSISESLLVKTAFFGKDPNWGRIACAAGYSGAEIKESSLSIYFEDIPLLINGSPAKYNMKKLYEILNKKKFSITINLGIGDASSSYLTTDLSYEYIKINAEYTT